MSNSWHCPDLTLRYDNQLIVRCSAQQRAGLIRLSAASGVTPSEILRELVTTVLAARYSDGKDPQETVDTIATALGLDPKTTTPTDLIKVLQDCIDQLNAPDPMGESPDPQPLTPNPNAGLQSLQRNQSLILTDHEKVCLAKLTDPAHKTRFLDRRRQHRIDAIINRKGTR